MTIGASGVGANASAFASADAAGGSELASGLAFGAEMGWATVVAFGFGAGCGGSGDGGAAGNGSGRTVAIRVESIRTPTVSVACSVASEYRPGDAGLAGFSGCSSAPGFPRDDELIPESQHTRVREFVSQPAEVGQR